MRLRPHASSALALTPALLLASALASMGCPPSPRDVVPETHDVRGVASGAEAPNGPEPYLHVARRPHASIGLVGAHFMSAPDAEHLVDRLADELETCARRVEQRGELASGAVQLVAVTGSRGTAEVTDVRLSPGGPVAANALECIIAPLRATAMPVATNRGIPALAVEAVWGPSATPTRDARSDSGSSR